MPVQDRDEANEIGRPVHADQLERPGEGGRTLEARIRNTLGTDEEAEPLAVVARGAPNRSERRYGEGLPSELTSALKILVAGSLVVAVVWGPPYHACRRIKEQGQLYYGTTVRSCVRDKMAEDHRSVEAVVRTVLRL